MKKTKIKLGVFTLPIILLIFFTLNNYLLVIITPIIIHELGHIVAAWILNIKISEFSVGILGARLKTGPDQLSYGNEIILALFGPLANFLCVFVGYVIYKKYNFHDTYLFLMTSLLLGAINLLPIKTFDGGRIFESFLSIFLPLGWAVRITYIISLICIITLWLISVYFLLIYSSSLGLFVFSLSLFFEIFVSENLS